MVDDLEAAAAGQLLELDQGEVGLDAGRVAVHQEADGSRRGEDRGLRVAVAVLFAQLDRAIPALVSGVDELFGSEGVIDGVHAVAVHPHHFQHALAVVGISLEGALGSRHFRGQSVRLTGHDGGDRSRHGAALVRVVREALDHQQRAEVGVTQPERAELVAALGDALGGIAGQIDRDLLGEEEDAAGVLVALDVELAGFFVQKLQ